MEKSTVTLTLENPETSLLHVAISTPNLNVALNMLLQAAREVQHQIQTDRQQQAAAKMMADLRVSAMMKGKM